MAGTLTITSKIGPGITVTSQVVNNVTSIEYDLVNMVVKVSVNGAPSPVFYDINADTTFTITRSGSNYTLAIS